MTSLVDCEAVAVMRRPRIKMAVVKVALKAREQRIRIRVLRTLARALSERDVLSAAEVSFLHFLRDQLNEAGRAGDLTQ